MSINTMKQELRELLILTGKWVFGVVTCSEAEITKTQSRIKELRDAIAHEEAQCTP